MKKCGFILLLAVSTFSLSSCRLLAGLGLDNPGPVREDLVMENVNVVEVEDNGFNNSTHNFESKKVSRTFSKTIMALNVRHTIKFTAMGNGEHYFDSPSRDEGLKLYVDTNHFASDVYRSFPFTQELLYGHTYSLHLMATDEKYLNETIQIFVTSPNVSSKRLEACGNFVDNYSVKLEDLFYYFKPTSTGYYKFTVEDNHNIKVYEDGDYKTETGWGTYAGTLIAGREYTFKVSFKRDKALGEVKGKLSRVLEDVDITSEIASSDIVALKIKTYYEDQTQNFSFTAPVSGEYTFSTTDIGYTVDSYGNVNSKNGVCSGTIKDIARIGKAHEVRKVELEAGQTYSFRYFISTFRTSSDGSDSFAYVTIAKPGVEKEYTYTEPK